MSGWTPEPEDLTPEEAERAQAAEYLVGLMDPTERKAFEARLRAEPRLRAQVAAWAEHLATLTEDIPSVAPPPHLETRIRKQLFEAQRPSRSFGLRILPWLAGAAVAAALAFVAVNRELLLRPMVPELEARIAAEDGSLVVQATFDADTRRLVLDRVAGEVPEGRDLELWLVRLEDGQPVSTVSLGVIPRDPEGVIEVSADLAAEFPRNALALSDEPLGGSPTGQATGPVVALGPLAPI